MDPLRSSTSEDSVEVFNVDDLLSSLQKPAEAPQDPGQERSAAPFQLVRQETFVSAYETNQLVADLFGEKQKGNGSTKQPDPLEYFIERLSKVVLPKFKDATKELAIRGKNVLHFIAEKPDFAPYEKVIQKIRNKKWFPALLSQTTEDTHEAPLHAICRCQNIRMFESLRQSKHVEVLKMSGIHNATDGNAFLCFGKSLFDNAKTIDRAIGVRMFDALVELYGQDCPMLLKGEDKQGRTFMALICLAERDDLVPKMQTLLQSALK
jgi:hypothetical protein